MPEVLGFWLSSLVASGALLGGGLLFLTLLRIPLTWPFLEEGRPSGRFCPQGPSCLPLQTNTGIRRNLEQEIIHYSFQSSFFDIFVSDPRFQESAGKHLWLGCPSPSHIQSGRGGSAHPPAALSLPEAAEWAPTFGEPTAGAGR